MPERKQSPVRHAGILTDVTRCIGCLQCVGACKQANGTGEERRWRWSMGDGLGAERWTTLISRPGDRSVRKQCRHCLHPACVSACPVGALERTAQGAVIYHTDRCMGCRYCMMSCPYGIPRYTWSRRVPYPRKCIFCHPRISIGGRPACTEACPGGATIFGERADLLLEAKKRIKAAPKRYLPRVWGEKEVGGTSILYLSDIDLGFLGWSEDLGNEPLPEITGSALMAVPPLFVGVGVLAGGIYWVLKRRRELAARAADNEGEDD